MTNKIPLDIESILEIGVDKWFDTFDWPFSWSEFVKLEDEVKSILKNHIESCPKYADIIIINYKIYIEFANYFLALILKEKIGDRVIITDNNYYYRDVFNEGIPLSPIIKFPKLKKNKTIKNKLRRLKKYLIDNDFKIPKFGKETVYILDESRSQHTIDYLQKNNLGNIRPISFFDFYSNDHAKELTQENKAQLRNLAISIKEDLVKLVRDYNILLNIKQENFIEDHTFTLFEQTKKTLETVKQGVKKNKIKLFIGANNNYYSRIISTAIRNGGGEIHGFKHGEPINYKYDLVSWLDLSLNDYYYEYTDKNTKMLDEIAKEFPPLNNNRCIIKSMKNNRYETIFNDLVIQKTDNISTVMLIGNCFRHTSFSYATAVFPTMQLYIELNIVYKLKSKGYKVIYKMHPENLDKKVGFVKDFSVFKALFPDDVEINSESFESTTQQVDAYAFYYTGTSTFLTAMISKKPILLFDIKLREYPKAMLDILTSRCDYILTKINCI